jgi:hypothetical protein
MQLASRIEKALHNVQEEQNADVLFHSEQELFLGISLSSSASSAYTLPRLLLLLALPLPVCPL